jgi:hypothetical protein
MSERPTSNTERRTPNYKAKAGSSLVAPRSFVEASTFYITDICLTNFLRRGSPCYFGANEATRLRQGFGVVNGCMDYFGARD